MNSTSKPNQRGFTLIEIMVVVVIIGVLGAIVVPQFMNRPDQAKVTAARTDIQAIATALEMYRLDTFSYPSTQQGLEALSKHPAGSPVVKNWNPQGVPQAAATGSVGHALSIPQPGYPFDRLRSVFLGFRRRTRR